MWYTDISFVLLLFYALAYFAYMFAKISKFFLHLFLLEIAFQPLYMNYQKIKIALNSYHDETKNEKRNKKRKNNNYIHYH